MKLGVNTNEFNLEYSVALGRYTDQSVNRYRRFSSSSPRGGLSWAAWSWRRHFDLSKRRRNWLPVDVAKHPGRIESSAPSLRELTHLEFGLLRTMLETAVECGECHRIETPLSPRKQRLRKRFIACNNVAMYLQSWPGRKLWEHSWTGLRNGSGQKMPRGSVVLPTVSL